MAAPSAVPAMAAALSGGAVSLCVLFYVRLQRGRRLREASRRLRAARHRRLRLRLRRRFAALWLGLCRPRAGAPGPGRERRLWSKARSSAFWQTVRDKAFSGGEWAENFRLGPGTFDFLCGRLRAAIERRDTSMRRAVPAEVRLALTLWRLGACTEYRAVEQQFGVSRSTVCKILRDVCEAVVAILAPVYAAPPRVLAPVGVGSRIGSGSGAGSTGSTGSGAGSNTRTTGSTTGSTGSSTGSTGSSTRTTGSTTGSSGSSTRINTGIGTGISTGISTRSSTGSTGSGTGSTGSSTRSTRSTTGTTGINPGISTGISTGSTRINTGTTGITTGTTGIPPRTTGITPGITPGFNTGITPGSPPGTPPGPGFALPQLAGVLARLPVPIRAPAEDAASYSDGRGWHSVVLQAAVDSRGCFWAIEVGRPGAGGLRGTALYRRAQSGGGLCPAPPVDIGGVSVPPFLLGRPRDPLLPWLLRPYRRVNNGGGSRGGRRGFNAAAAAARGVAAAALGGLRGRWRCLQKRNDTDLGFLPTLLAACCLLHNVCQARGEPCPPRWMAPPPGDPLGGGEEEEEDEEEEEEEGEEGGEGTEAWRIREALAAALQG